ncbi:MAG: glycosyltransferase family 1 protein [Methylococcales symbiont of Hymedesmia sp. n. MRB-2018]|nr:MAG: glycosyltransferase family 1 protein [Methylococcales symbiont of Hymedesmia sp. n. MRB-2018]
MQVLMLVIDEQRYQLESLYESVAKNCDLDLCRLSSKQQANLSAYFKKNVGVAKYERIILFLRFKKMFKQTAFIRRIPNLVILEHDACQNYYPESKYKGKFSQHFAALPWARVLVSSVTLADKLKKEGADAHFVPKIYDSSLLRNKHQQRTIDLGFIGSTQNDIYRKRRAFLEQAREQLGLFITRTRSGKEYLEMLNKIRFFLSADIGFGEYMAKNFEAMACGCVLLAYSQGEKEEKALGFEDMVNVVLYTDITELEEKLTLLREDPQLVSSIAKNGQTLVEAAFSSDSVGSKIVDAITPMLREKDDVSPFDYARYFFRH